MLLGGGSTEVDCKGVADLTAGKDDWTCQGWICAGLKKGVGREFWDNFSPKVGTQLAQMKDQKR